ncbi:DUF5808 domain-containing protein [Desulforamulus ruminis]|uniref:Uncharacterized protein n=1 Tax=Desulforamulus ruminis (strain ATCC 23193 / DSM 2154 / NCIMB 8452 / DL) TaxID=696281 RepID=F6DTR6_DESRL|nr:DUF5808 domain-containing protein [Desulforamulus ruminis]AEG61240.1 hypothetical protein Desru_3029 [Desulforamulus ruminis DSM 2154]
MLLSLLIIAWLSFGTMAFVALFYKDHHDRQILGVVLSQEHAKSPQVQATIQDFKRACYTVLLLSVGLSLFMLIQTIRPYAEFYMLFLVMANLFANWFIIHRFQQRLQSIKRKNQWVYPQSRIIRVDLNVSKEKGKSAVTSIWIWLFLLISFIPTAFLIFHPQMQESYPIGFSLIGPLCQLSTIYFYYQMKNRQASVLSDNTEINKACARTEERINTMSATLSSLAMLVFWILFNISIIYIKNDMFTALSVVILVSFLLAIANWQQRKIRAAQHYFFGEVLKDDSGIYEQESTWKWGFYYNPNDPRIIVPKRIANMGWTINIGRPAGKAIGAGVLVFFLGIIGIVAYGGFKDYTITENNSKIMIDAAMYDISLEKNQVISVSITDKIPKGTRTNGYGGVNKSFGHFSIEGFGKCMLYIYNDVDKYIVLKLEGDDPGYVIVNDKSQDKTEQLYQTIKQWLEE